MTGPLDALCIARPIGVRDGEAALSSDGHATFRPALLERLIEALSNPHTPELQTTPLELEG